MKIFRIKSQSEQESQDYNIREKMAGHSVPPPAFVWGNIEQELNKPARNRRRFILLLATLAACVGGITFGVLTFLYTNPDSATQTANTNILRKEESFINSGNYNNNNTAQAENENYSQTKSNNPGNNLNSGPESFANATAGKNKLTENAAEPGETDKKDAAYYNTKEVNTKNDYKTGNLKKNNSVVTKSNANNSLAIKKKQLKKSAGNMLSGNDVKPDVYRENKLPEALNVPVITEKKAVAVSKENEVEETHNAAVEKPLKTDSVFAINKADSLLAENKISAEDKGNNKNKAVLGKWSFGIHAAPGISYRALIDNNTKDDVTMDLMASAGTNRGNTTDPNYFDRSNVNEKAIFSYSAGISAGYAVSSKFSLQSGFYYLKTGYSSSLNLMAFNYVANSNDNPGTTGTGAGSGNPGLTNSQDTNNTSLVPTAQSENSSAGSYEFEALGANNSGNYNTNNFNQGSFVQMKVYNYFEWIRIPLHLRYTSGGDKLKWFVQSGFSANLLVNKYAELVLDQYGIRQKVRGNIVGNYRNVGIGAALSAGIEVGLGKNISLEFRPEFEYTLSAIANNPLHSLHPYVFQFNTGLVKRF